MSLVTLVAVCWTPHQDSVASGQEDLGGGGCSGSSGRMVAMTETWKTNGDFYLHKWCKFPNWFPKEAKILGDFERKTWTYKTSWPNHFNAVHFVLTRFKFHCPLPMLLGASSPLKTQKHSQRHRAGFQRVGSVSRILFFLPDSWRIGWKASPAMRSQHFRWECKNETIWKQSGDVWSFLFFCVHWDCLRYNMWGFILKFNAM